MSIKQARDIFHLRRDLEKLVKQLEFMNERLTTLEAKRGPGRPPKAIQPPVKVNDA